MAKFSVKKQNDNGANLGFEAQLWATADKLRGNMEPSDYKHVALGLIFLKYISDAFEAKRAELLQEELADAEDPEEYLAENVFWVPKEARWSHLQAKAKQPTIGKDIDDAMLAIEASNASLKGVLPKDHARPALNKVMLGEMIDLVSGIGMGCGGRPLARHSRAGVRVLSGRLRRSRGQTRRRVLHAAIRRPAAGRDAGAPQGPRLRPLLRLRRHVRPVREVRQGARRAHRGHRHLRAGEQLHDLAARQDEPRGARHRRRHPLEQRGQLPQGRAPGPQVRLHPCQSTFQHFRLGWRPAAGRRPLEVRRAARGQRQLRLASAHPPSPRAERDGGRGARQRLHVLRRSPGRATYAAPWSRATWWTA